jgi:hypothetical protein
MSSTVIVIHITILYILIILFTMLTGVSGCHFFFMNDTLTCFDLLWSSSGADFS